jgi:alpha-mannosidase
LKQARLTQAGLAFNHPLLAVAADVHPGELPGRYGWLELSPSNVIVSAVKVAEAGGALALRLYESAGMGTVAQLRLPEGFPRGCQTNLLEDPGPAVLLVGRELSLAFQPFEIKTLLLFP